MQLERIAHVVKSDAMGELGVQERHNVAPGRKGSGLDTAFPRQFGNQMRWNEVANLAEDDEVRACWVDAFVFHLCRVADLNSSIQHFLQFLRDACEINSWDRQRNCLSCGRILVLFWGPNILLTKGLRV